MINKQILKWIPSVVFMLTIFIISSQPSYRLPSLDWGDKIFKKGGHMVGYGLLALSYWYAFGWAGSKRWLAWLLAVLYACTDEFHQSFVLGRHPSVWDVLIFDNFGALISLWVAERYFNRRKQDENT